MTEHRWIDDKDGRFWTIERAESSILSPQFQDRARKAVRKQRPLSTMFFSTRPSLAELQEATLSGVAEAVYPLVEQRPASMPAGGSQQQTAFTQQVPRRLPSSGSGSLLSRRFTFYYWSVQSEDCFSIDCFLTDHAIPTPPKTDHAVSPLRGRAATQVVRAAKQLIIVHSPKHISKLVITDDTTDLALASLVLDREGFLKTPTVRVGNTVVTGSAT